MLPPIVKTSAEALAANINRFIGFLPSLAGAALSRSDSLPSYHARVRAAQITSTVHCKKCSRALYPPSASLVDTIGIALQFFGPAD
jgi:cytochrome c-type biogenesis protein CcmH/NrfF